MPLNDIQSNTFYAGSMVLCQSFSLGSEQAFMSLKLTSAIVILYEQVFQFGTTRLGPVQVKESMAFCIEVWAAATEIELISTSL